MFFMRRRILALFLLILVIASLGACDRDDPSVPKYIAMTFDDGPEYTWTPAVLDGLAQRGVHATFFMVGKWTPGKDEIIQRIQEEGHQIGCHTMNHESLVDKTDEEVLAELSGYEETMNFYTGLTDFWLRPPFGFVDERVAALCDVPVILWSIDPAAGETVPADKMEKIILKEAKDGAIILMHDTTEANYEAAMAAIDKLMEKGYVFVTVEELFRIKGVEPQPGQVYREIP